MATDKVVQQQLIHKGKTQGFITYDDILALVPAAEQNVDLLEELMDELTQAGISIVESTPTPAQPPEDLTEQIESDEPSDFDLEAPTDEELEDIEPLEFDLIDDAGYRQAIDTDDVVGLYLKEAGRVPLLTAEGEVALAKRMEAGELAKEQLNEYGSSL